MPMHPNIQIPLALFMDIVSFFNCLSLGRHSFPSIYNFERMHSELRAKLDKINLRTAYTNAIIEKDDDQRRNAYLIYQNLKNKRKPCP